MGSWVGHTDQKQNLQHTLRKKRTIETMSACPGKRFCKHNHRTPVSTPNGRHSRKRCHASYRIQCPDQELVRVGLYATLPLCSWNRPSLEPGEIIRVGSNSFYLNKWFFNSAELESSTTTKVSVLFCFPVLCSRQVTQYSTKFKTTIAKSLEILLLQKNFPAKKLNSTWMGRDS